MEYKVIVRFKLSSICGEVAEIENGLNETLSGAGFDEKLQVMSSLHIGNLTVSRKLEHGEEVKMKAVFENELSKVFKECKVEFNCSQSSSNSKQ